MTAADAKRALSALAPDVIPRIMPDLHVGAGGAVEAAANLFSSPPVPGFNQSAINCETNAGTHDLRRALNEAADLIDFFTADVAITSRIYARTASFCFGSSNNFDTWDQALAFFLPNMTWLQPPGYVHTMIKQTWAEQVLAADGAGAFPFAAQRTADSRTLVLRAVNPSASVQPFGVSLLGASVAGLSFQVLSLGGTGFSDSDDNTPAAPTFISPISATRPIPAGATNITFSLEPLSFIVALIPLA